MSFGIVCWHRLLRFVRKLPAFAIDSLKRSRPMRPRRPCAVLVHAVAYRLWRRVEFKRRHLAQRSFLLRVPHDVFDIWLHIIRGIKTVHLLLRKHQNGRFPVNAAPCRIRENRNWLSRPKQSPMETWAHQETQPIARPFKAKTLITLNNAGKCFTDF